MNEVKYYYWSPGDYSPTYLFTMTGDLLILVGMHSLPIGYGTNGLIDNPENHYSEYVKTHIIENGIDVPYRKQITKNEFERYLKYNK